MAHDAKNVWAAVVWVCYLKSFFVRYNISLANNLNANHIRAMDEYDRKRMKLMMSLTQTSKAYKTVADKRVSGFGLSQAMAMPAVMEPPGELMYSQMSFFGSSAASISS